MGMGKGLLDSLIAEGGVKSRDLRKLGIYMGMDFMAIPTSLLFRRNFLHLLVIIGVI